METKIKKFFTIKEIRDVMPGDVVRLHTDERGVYFLFSKHDIDDANIDLSNYKTIYDIVVSRKNFIRSTSIYLSLLGWQSWNVDRKIYVMRYNHNS